MVRRGGCNKYFRGWELPHAAALSQRLRLLPGLCFPSRQRTVPNRVLLPTKLAANSLHLRKLLSWCWQHLPVTMHPWLLQ